MVSVRAKNQGTNTRDCQPGPASHCPHATHPTLAPVLIGHHSVMDPRRRGSITQSPIPSSPVTRPGSGPGAVTPEKALDREGAATTWLRVAAGTRHGETIEPQAQSEGKIFPGECYIFREGPALDSSELEDTGRHLDRCARGQPH